VSLPIPHSYREPASLIARDICPHCHYETVRYRFMTPDGHWMEAHHCHEHGAVAPMRSVVIHQRVVAARSSAPPEPIP
jgi:hypothetical protein